MSSTPSSVVTSAAAPTASLYATFEDDFKCKRCHQLSSNVWESACCNSLICNDCVASLTVCPNCSAPLQTRANPALSRLMGEMTIGCPLGCSNRFKLSDKASHLNSECPNRTVNCQRCTREVKVNDFALHRSQCSAACPYVEFGCSAEVLRASELDTHMISEREQHMQLLLNAVKRQQSTIAELRRTIATTTTNNNNNYNITNDINNNATTPQAPDQARTNARCHTRGDCKKFVNWLNETVPDWRDRVQRTRSHVSQWVTDFRTQLSVSHIILFLVILMHTWFVPSFFKMFALAMSLLWLKNDFNNTGRYGVTQGVVVAAVVASFLGCTASILFGVVTFLVLRRCCRFSNRC